VKKRRVVIGFVKPVNTVLWTRKKAVVADVITSINITETKRWNWMRMVIRWMKNIMRNTTKNVE
jgi:hypothetical protein